MLITDPPYNVDYVGGTKDALKIQNDNMDSLKFREFLADAFTAADMVMRPGAAFYIWHADTNRADFLSGCEAAGWQIRQALVWVKNSMVLGRQDYQWRHEPCLYGWKEGAGHYFIDARTLTTVADDIDNLNREQLLERIKELSALTTTIYEDKPTRSDLHPTMKPLGLFKKQIRNSSREGETVLDLFGGSGTTLIACEEMNRKCCMMEFDPFYASAIIKRWETETGYKAERIDA